MSSNPKQQQQQQMDVSSSTIGGKSIFGEQVEAGQAVTITTTKSQKKQSFLQKIKRKGKQTGTAVFKSLPSLSFPSLSSFPSLPTFSLPSVSSLAVTPNVSQKSMILFLSYFVVSLIVFLLFRIPSFFNGIFKTSLTRTGIMVPFTILFSKKRETVLEKTGVNLSGMKWYTVTFLYVVCIWYVLAILYFFSFGILAFLAGTVYILKGKTDQKLVRRFSDPFWKYVAHPYALIRHLLLLPLQFLNIVMMSTTATLSTPATFITALIVFVWIIVYFSSK